MRILQQSIWRRFGLLALYGTIGLGSQILAAGNSATGPATEPPAAQTPAEVAPSRLEGFSIQPGDEPLKTFQPKNAPAPEKEMQADALARFMTGRIQQEKGNFSAALESYLAAIEKAPTAIQPYQAALPILLQRQENERARKLTLSAAEKNADGYDLVLAMAAIFARQDRLDEGIQLIKSAMELPSLQKNSVADLSLHRDLGLYSRIQGNFKAAATEYEVVFNALISQDFDEESRKKLLVEPGQMFDEFGDVFLKAGNPELALKAFDEASKHREARPGLNSYNLATVFRQTGNSEKALAELQGYFDAQLQTRGRAAYELLKDLLKDLNREEELLTKLEALHKQDEHNESLRYFLADELLEKGDLARAESLYLNGRTEATDPRAMVGMFSIHRQQKNFARLIALLPKAFTSIPRGTDQDALKQMAPDVQDLATRFENEINALEKDEDTFKALAAFARAQEKQEDAKVDFLTTYLLGKLATEGDYTDEAEYFYRLAISMRNDPPATLYREIAIHLLQAERYEVAIKLLDDAVNHTSSALKRERWNLLYLLSYGYSLDGNTEKAINAIREAQSLQPNQPLLHYHEAWINYHARNWDVALAQFEQFIKKYGNDKEHVLKSRFHISNIYVEQGNMEQGEKILEDILVSDPENAQANNDLGYLYADQGKHLERAEGMIRKALAQEPDNRAYQDSLGWVLYRLGRYSEALVELEKATSDKKMNDATLMDHLGDCLEKVGRHEEAVAAWQRGLDHEQEKKNPSEKILKSLKSKLKIEETPATPTPESPAPETSTPATPESPEK